MLPWAVTRRKKQSVSRAENDPRCDQRQKQFWDELSILSVPVRHIGEMFEGPIGPEPYWAEPSESLGFGDQVNLHLPWGQEARVGPRSPGPKCVGGSCGDSELARATGHDILR
jgi:hypothetical protein